MEKNMMYNTPAYSFNNGSTCYTVYAEKKTRHGITALVKTPGGNWIVANGLRHFTPKDPEALVMNADWAHGHYFMEDKVKAVRYYENEK